MQILLVIFFFPFPTPFFWRQVNISAGVGHPDNSVSQLRGEVTRVKHSVTVRCNPHLGPARHPVCLFLYLSCSKAVSPASCRLLQNVHTPAGFTLSVGGSNLLHPALRMGSSLIILFPGEVGTVPDLSVHAEKSTKQSTAYVKVLLEIL